MCVSCAQEPTRTCGTGADGNRGSTRRTRTPACRRTRIAVSMPAKSSRRPPSSWARCRDRSGALKKPSSRRPCRSRTAAAAPGRPRRRWSRPGTNEVVESPLGRLQPCTSHPPCRSLVDGPTIYNIYIYPMYILYNVLHVSRSAFLDIFFFFYISVPLEPLSPYPLNPSRVPLIKNRSELIEFFFFFCRPPHRILSRTPPSPRDVRVPPPLVE